MDVFERHGLGNHDASISTSGASNCSSRYEGFREFEGWENTEIDYQKCEFASFEYEIDESKYRLVVQRSPKKEDRKIVTDMFGGVYVYGAIITTTGI